MSFIYNEAKNQFALGNLNLLTDDLRVLLVAVSSGAATAFDANFVSALTPLNEYVEASYARQTIPTAGRVLTEIAGSGGHVEFDGQDVVWSALAANATNAIGAVLFKFITNDAASIPIAYINDGGFPFNGTGSDVTLQWNAAGILQIG